MPDRTHAPEDQPPLRKRGDGLAGRLPKEELNRIPWREIIGLRNILIHDYGEVNYARIWGTIREDLPDLIAQIKSHTS